MNPLQAEDSSAAWGAERKQARQCSEPVGLCLGQNGSTSHAGLRDQLSFRKLVTCDRSKAAVKVQYGGAVVVYVDCLHP